MNNRMKYKKQITTFKNLIDFYGITHGTMMFSLRYLNRKKYYQLIIDDLKKEFKNYLPSLNKKILDLPLKKISESSCNVWVLWYQGIENAPKVVQKNIEQLKRITQNTDFNVVVLNSNNLSKYLQLPAFILKKVRAGNITLTHLSDIIRAGLLSEKGGIWLDATCYVTENNFNEVSDFLFYSQKYAPNQTEFFNEGKWSGFFMASGQFNPLETYLYDMFLKYHETFKNIVDYFLIDILIELGYQEFDIIKKLIDDVPYNNSKIMEITDNFNAPMSFSKDFRFDDTWIFKLDWRTQISSNNATFGIWFYKNVVFKEKE